MAKLAKKSEAIKLRREGLSFPEISERLGISKSTAGLWCRDLELSVEEMGRLLERTKDARSKGRLIGAKMNRDLRELRVKDAEKWAQNAVGSSLSVRDALMLGTGLYWGEGAKGRKLSFANSNPDMLIFTIKWFKLLGVASEDFLVRVYINESHRDRYCVVMNYWVSTLGIPKEQFYAPTFVKSQLQKVYENRETYYGVVAVRIRRSTVLQDKILGLIKSVSNAGVAQLVRAQHS